MAIAPEQIGIGIRRYFTRPGQHPYDTVAWERREARIPNYKDGTDAFLQPDVEFPVTWSQNATNIVAQKYFRGTLGTEGREHSLRQVFDRIVDTITAWGVRDGYFVDEQEGAAFRNELKYILTHQRAAFNSPVWFNIGVEGVPNQGSACFILSVEDTMDGILNWYREEGVIFKGGSGSGINLSKIRSSHEQLAGGGTASGPVSFMRGADASAGTIKSGGKTRRAAKMVVLNADHPDIEEFIWCKAREERKARALRDAGFDMDLDGIDSHSVQYQNANNSVRVTDEFMRAVEEDRDWDLVAVTTGEVLKTVKARDLMRQIAEAAWECADPGMQYDTTINRWHTVPNTGPITASNPCFPASEFVHTDRGLLRFGELVERAQTGDLAGVYTHDATSLTAPGEEVEVTRPDAIMLSGFNEIIKLTFSNGMQLRCTPNHGLFTTNRGYVAAADLTPDDRIKVLDLPAPAICADWRLPSAARSVLTNRNPRERRSMRLPEKWSTEFGHYIGWLVGGGCLTDLSAVTVYGGDEEQAMAMPAHRDFLAHISGRFSKPSLQGDGTAQLRIGCRAFRDLLEVLGVSRERAVEKTVPDAIYQAPTEVVAAFLRGLFDADGCVSDRYQCRYVGLGSTSDELLRGVQRLLSTFGIFSRIDKTRAPRAGGFAYERKDGAHVEYAANQFFDLRISSASLERFADWIGFSLPAKSAKLACCLVEHDRNTADHDIRLTDRRDDGIELTYNLCEPRNHSYVVNGVVVRNCSEYMSLDNSACNLASINLLKFLNDDGTFDIEAFQHTVEVVFTAQEIIVGNGDYPTDKIAETTRRFRQLGLGYANLGALLMAQGLPYDSPDGRAWAATITALMTGHAYATSARTARRMGPCAGFAENAEPMVNVLRMHRAEVAKVDEDRVPPDLLGAAQRAWDDAVEIAEKHGVRNSQAVVIAPTGTIGLAMDCDTTGIEPDLALTKAKKLVGGGTMFIVNQTVPRALANLGYADEEASAIIDYIDEHKSIVGAPGFKAKHLPVFACSMGDNTIHYMGHVKMMAAVQPFISGAISKTANMPESATVEEVEQLYLDSWKLGIKAIALYRDNCKVGQPLATQRKGSAAEEGDQSNALTKQVERVVEHVIVQSPVRQKLPRTRASKTFSFRVADCHGYATVGEFEDGRPGEVFLRVAKQGSTLAGIMDAFAISVSHGLQYGVPLRAFVEMFTNMRFEPAGITDDPEIRIATSLVDYIFRRLAVEYLSVEERSDLGIFTVAERLQPTLPGVEEAVTPNPGGFDVLPPEDRAPSAAITAVPTESGTTTPVRYEGEVVLCYVCGDIMQRAGSCHACPSCGATSGCS